MTVTKHGSKPEEGRESQEGVGTRQGASEGIADFVRAQTQPRATDSHRAAPVQVADAGRHSSAEAYLGRVQLYDSAREGDRRAQQRQPGDVHATKTSDRTREGDQSRISIPEQHRDNIRAYERPVNFYGKLDRQKIEDLAHNTSVVLAASECTPENIKALREAAARDKPPHPIRIEGYISSSGFPKTDAGRQQEQAFFDYMYGDPPKGAGLKRKDYPPSKIFEQAQQGKDALDAHRINETDTDIHNAYEKYLVDQVGNLRKAGADGVFIDDVDNDLIKLRDLARGRTWTNGDGTTTKGTPNMEDVLKYQRGINNHIDTVAAIQSAMGSKSVTINRGQDYTQLYNVACGDATGDWQTVVKDGHPEIHPVATENNNLDNQQGIRYKDKVKLDAIFGAGTSRVMFEAVNNTVQANLYHGYLQELCTKDPASVIEYTAYRADPKTYGDTDPNKRKDLKHGYVTQEQQAQNIEHMLTGLTSEQLSWAEKHMVIKVYDNRNLADRSCKDAPDSAPMTLGKYLETHPEMRKRVEGSLKKKSA